MSAIDARVLRGLLADLGNDRQVLQELVSRCLHEAPLLLEEAQSAARRHEPEACERAVHTLKAVMATFGATRLAGRAKQLEMEARHGRLPSQNQFAELGTLWDEVRVELSHPIE